MRILLTKQSNLAGAPEAIAAVINKYTPHEAAVFDTRYSRSIDGSWDVVHHNNIPIGVLPDVPQLLQYHSEPALVDLEWSGPRFTLAQYHQFLPEYDGAQVLRNPVDIWDEQYTRQWPRPDDDLIRVAYTPSLCNDPACPRCGHKVRTPYNDKGYTHVLETMRRVGSHPRIRFLVVHARPRLDAVRVKAWADIVIDDVVTGSYHRSGLEGLASGSVVVCMLNEPLQRWFIEHYDEVPFDWSLELAMAQALRSREALYAAQQHTRSWMVRNWAPDVVAGEYIRAYQGVIDAHQ